MDLQERVPPRFEGPADRFTYLLAEYKIGIYVSVVAIAILFASGRAGLPTIPTWWKPIIEMSAIGAIPATILAKVMVVDPWIPDPRHNVLWIDDERLVPRAKKVPRNLWENRERGDFPAWVPPEGPFDFVVTGFEYLEDVGELRIEGCNEEVVNELELLTTQGKIEEIHGQLLQDRAELDRLKAQRKMSFLEMEQRHVNSLIAAVEHGLEFDPGTASEVIEGGDDLEGPTAEDREGVDRTDDQADERPTLSDMIGDDGGDLPAATDGGSDR